MTHCKKTFDVIFVFFFAMTFRFFFFTDFDVSKRDHGAEPAPPLQNA